MDDKIATSRDAAGGSGGGRALRAALFVDFDNLFISFEDLDGDAAHRFATQPERWIAWLESGAHAAEVGEDGETLAATPRRILVRRCYLNPNAFGRQRPFFIRAAFNVVDCPPLTRQGKTSADIYMVMDILDALDNHKTEFDEFIILSADADFTPVLLRLRARDRRTTIVSTHLAAAAYKAAADLVVPYERFFEEALGLEPEPASGRADRGGADDDNLGNGGSPGNDDDANDPLLARVAWAVRQRAAEQGGWIAGRELSGVFQSFPEFRGSNWFGFYSLKTLTARLIRFQPDLAFAGDPDGAWNLRLREPDGGGGDAANGGAEDHEDGAAAASPSPGRSPASASDEPHDELAALVRRVAHLTGVPPLAPIDYAALFRAIEEAAQEDHPSFGEFARRVHELAEADGAEVSRRDVNFVLSGYRHHGDELGGRDAAALAGMWRDNVLMLVDNAQLPLAPGERGLIDRWLLSEVGAEAGVVDRPDDGDDDVPAEPVTAA